MAVYSKDSGALWGLSVFLVTWLHHRSSCADSSSFKQLKTASAFVVFSVPLRGLEWTSAPARGKATVKIHLGMETLS